MQPRPVGSRGAVGSGCWAHSQLPSGGLAVRFPHPGWASFSSPADAPGCHPGAFTQCLITNSDFASRAVGTDRLRWGRQGWL